MSITTTVMATSTRLKADLPQACVLRQHPQSHVHFNLTVFKASFAYARFGADKRFAGSKEERCLTYKTANIMNC